MISMLNITKSTKTHARRTSLRSGRAALLLAGGLVASLLSGVLASGTAAAATRPCMANLCLYASDMPSESLTAASNWDIGPTPYFISIFNQTTGDQLALCGSDTSCVTGAGVYPPMNRCYFYVAYIGGAGSAMPPAPVRRTSDTVRMCNHVK